MRHAMFTPISAGLCVRKSLLCLIHINSRVHVYVRKDRYGDLGAMLDFIQRFYNMSWSVQICSEHAGAEV